MTPKDRWREARRVLVVRLDGMGDLLMTTPAIAALRGASRHVTALVSDAGAAVAPLVPAIDDVIVHRAPWMKPGAAPRDPVHPDAAARDSAPHDSLSRDSVSRDSAPHDSTSRTSLPPDSPLPDSASRDAIIARLREARFDAAVIFTVATQSALPAALLCYYAGIPLRLAHARENPYDLLTDWVPDREAFGICRHEVRRQLDLVATAGASIDDDRLRIRVPDASRERVARLLGLHGVPASRFVLLHPGASAPSRRYPPELFAEAASLLAERTGRPLVFSGGPEDIALVEDIRARLRAPSVSFAGALDLPDLAALIEAAPLLVCNNSGPSHIAAAAGTRTVVLYALTNPQHTPWRVASRVLSHEVPCRDCLKSVCPESHHACLRGVPPARVAAAAEELLEGPTARGHGLRGPLAELHRHPPS
ncbi:MAG: glycosyltransferase family 9 protein [Polyangiaceae bacterium]